MPSLSKQQFFNDYQAASVQRLMARLEDAGVSLEAAEKATLRAALVAADTDGDGKIGTTAQERRDMWSAIDDLDRDGNPSRVTQGRGSGYDAASAIRRPAGSGTRPFIAEVAHAIINSPEGAQWGSEAGDLCVIRNPRYEGGGLTSSLQVRRPSVLDGLNKCSVFVGEVLFAAGFEPPYSSWRPASGSRRHYEQAVSWHKHTRAFRGQRPLFNAVATLPDLEPGDVMTIQRWDGDRWATRDNGGHVMLVLWNYNPAAGLVGLFPFAKRLRIVQMAEASASAAQYDWLTSALSAEGVGTSGQSAHERVSTMTRSSDQHGVFYELTSTIRIRFLRPTRVRR